MLSAPPLALLPYERRYRTPVLELIRYSYLRHTHLDWYEAETWLDNIGGVTRTAWRGGALAGVMSASLPLGGKSWVRIACVGEGWPEDEVMRALWEAVRAGLREVGARECWLLAIDPWIEGHTVLMGMRPSELLVSMRRGSSVPLRPPPDVPAGLLLESADLKDVAAIAAVDQQAFAAPFQMTALDMRYAYRSSALCTVARLHGEVVGYQLSTRHGSVGHLARLGVRPDMQGQRVGAALLREMIAAFVRRQVEVITVNTQRSNLRSQEAYHAYGFERTHYDVPMFAVTLEEVSTPL
jgi:ribosomal protein S18 acetylase RimI-like enzyme